MKLQMRVSRHDGVLQRVPAVEAWPGLAVHRMPAWEGVSVYARRWTVSHIRTGRFIAHSFPSQSSALRAAEAFGTVLDWTRPTKEIMKQADVVPLLRGIALSLGGTR